MKESSNNRGRPFTGRALTPAQKQKAYRLRQANKQNEQQQISEFESLYNDHIAFSIAQAKQRIQEADNERIKEKHFHDMQSLIDFRDSFKKIIKSNVSEKYKQVELI